MDPDQYASLGMLNEMGALVDRGELARCDRKPVLKVNGVLTTDTPQKLAAIDFRNATESHSPSPGAPPPW
jgi:hypothetical protein